MLFVVFVANVLGLTKPLELTPENLGSIIGGNMPAFISYYSQFCGYSMLTNEEFDDMSECFEPSDIIIARFNCSKYLSKCNEKKINGYPTIIFYQPKDIKGEIFNGYRLSDDFFQFIKERTKINGTKPRQYIEEINENNFYEKIKKNHFVLNLFYEKDKVENFKNDMASLRFVAKMFQKVDEDIGFTKIDCNENRNICNKFRNGNSDGSHFMVLFNNSDKNIIYSDPFTTEKILDFVNINCGTHRQLDGILDDNSGLIDEAQSLVKEFLESNDKKQVIEKMKRIEGTKDYVKAMEKYILKGEDQLKNDLFTMDDVISERKLKISKLDEMKKRRNIFAQFVTDLIRLMPPPLMNEL